MSGFIGGGGGGGLITALPVTVPQGGTGLITITDHGLMVGSGIGAVTPLAVGTNGMVLLGSTAADPVFASLTSTNGTITYTAGAGTLNLEADGLNQNNLIYVGKHGNDANDGLTVNKAFLTIQAAVTAASSNDTVWCFDDGTYTENLTGAVGISIFAPNATLAGVHTITTDNSWTFKELTVATAVTGITMNTAAQKAFVKAEKITISGTGVGIANVAGKLFIDVGDVTLAGGHFIGATTADETSIRFETIKVSSTGTVFAAVSGATLNITGNNIENTGIGNHITFATAGGGAIEINATISYILSEQLSDITAGTGGFLNVADLNGSINEAGAGSFRIGGSIIIENVAIGASIPSSGAFTTLTASTPVGVPSGGTGLATITDHGIMLGSGVGAITPLGVAGNGAIPIGSAGADPVLGNITSTGATLVITNGAGTINAETTGALQTDTGFEAWSAGGPYFDDTVLGQFSILIAGTGYIKGVAVTWAGAQTVTGMTAGNSYIIYIDDTGTIGKTTTYSLATFQDYIPLFECMRDSTAAGNIQVTTKENHPFDFPPTASYWAHETVGIIIENHAGGANITLNGTQKIQINGADELSDHGLYTDIADSGGVGVVWNKYFTLGSGKWARDSQSDTFTGRYNNAGATAALTAGKFGVYKLYVSKDNITTSTPVYFAVLHTAEYNNLAAAQTAIASGDIASASGELAFLELARLGYIIYKESTSTIVDVIIDKQTLSSGSTTSGTNIASLVLTDTTNFDWILSAADTNVQAALETIDEWGKTPISQGLITAGAGMTVTTGDATVTAGNLNLPTTNAALTEGVIEINSVRQFHAYGTNNLFVGAGSGNGTLTGSSNVGVGPGTLDALTSGLANIAIGGNALTALQGGSYNTCIGLDAGVKVTSGIGNMLIGRACGDDVTTGDYNVSVGISCLGQVTTGSYNTAIGFGAGNNITVADSDNVMIANNGVAGDNNTMRFGRQGTGNFQVDTTFIAGIYNTTPVGGNDGTVIIDSNGQLGSVAAAMMLRVDATGATQAMAVNTEYTTNRGAGAVAYTLPATTAVGDVIEIVGNSANGWTLAQNAGQTIHHGTSDSTTGAGGSLASANQYDCVTLKCVVANTDFTSRSFVGTITVT